MNPYFGKHFGSFLLLFGKRLFQLIQGSLKFEDLASDEVQIFVLVLLAISSALVGSFLVLRKMTMLANSLSHTILLGIVIAFIIVRSSSQDYGSPMISISEMFIAALCAGVLTALFTEMLTKTLRLQEDASIGLVFTSFFALGIICVSLFTSNVHIGAEAIMGNVDALHRNDLKLAFQIALFNVLITCIFFKQYQLTTFDPMLAKNLGICCGFFNYLLMFQTSASAIGSFRAVGVVLFLAFLVCPVLIAKLITSRLKILLLIACASGMFASMISVALSRHILTVYQTPLSTSGLSVCILVCIYLLTVFVKSLSSRRAYAK
ncbi:MAG: metal ABC transporter permease [Simkaniaceae bacterium]|nr:metal ABC transporter permease [Simkaniaceae bacterium]